MADFRIVSYAQNCEDVMLWRAFKDVTSGFYVDVGANSPTIDSVTQLFYDNGWHGINIEPLSPWIEQLSSRRSRDINLAVCASDKESDIELLDVRETGLSTGDLDLKEFYEDRFEVAVVPSTTTTLTAILSEHADTDIHFMKVDVEGMEYEVLNGCDFTKFRPRIVLVESIDPVSQEPNHHGWEPLLTKADYTFLYFDGLNRFYGADEHLPSLTPHFEEPPNIFDNFVRQSDEENAVALQQSLDTLHAKQTELETVHLRLQELLAQRADLEVELNAAEDDVLSLQAEVSELQNTLSWRVTTPLRWVRRLTADGPADAAFKLLRQRL